MRHTYYYDPISYIFLYVSPQMHPEWCTLTCIAGYQLLNDSMH